MDNKDLIPSNEPKKERPEIIGGIPEDAPPEVRRILERSYESITMMSGMMGPRESAVEKQVRPEHIPQFIGLKEKEAELAHKDSKSNRYFQLAIVLVIAVLVGLVLFLYRDQPEMVQKIIIPAITFIAGAGGGYGLGKSKRSE